MQPQQPYNQPAGNPPTPPPPPPGAAIYPPYGTAGQPQQISQTPSPIATTVPNSAMPQPQEAKSSDRGKKFLFIGIAVVVVLCIIGGGVVYASLHSTTHSTNPPSTNVSTSAASTHTGTSGQKKATSSTTTASSSEQKTTLDQSIQTPLGYTITATQLVTNFPLTDASQISNGYEPLLVGITVISNGSYTGATPSGFDFTLMSGGTSYPEGVAPISNGDYISDSDVSAAGFSPYDDATPDPSGGETGYLVFLVPKSAASFTLQYNEPEETAYGSGSTISAQAIDIPLH